MKHATLFLTVVVLAMMLGGSTALMQRESVKQLGEDSQTEQTNPLEDATPQTYISSGSRHKMILRREDVETYNYLLETRSILGEIDYDSFKLVFVDELAVGGRSALQSMAASVRDEQNVISFNGLLLDTTTPEDTFNLLPEDLRQTRMMDAVQRGGQPGKGLYIVQFVGPIKDKWLTSLRGTGAKIVSYIPSTAYVVRASRKAAARLTDFLKQNPEVQFIGDYEPAYRLSPELHMVRRTAGDSLVDITVQVINGPDAEKAIKELSGMANDVVGSYSI